MMGSYVLISIVISAASASLQCSLDQAEFSSILNDLRSKGYTVQKQTPGFLSSAGNSSNLAPNKGGAYASILRHNASYPLSIPFTYKMGAKTAVLFHGCTPPTAQYFGYKTYLWTNDQDIWIWGALGDVLNHRVISTYHRFTTNAAVPFDDLASIISTADSQTYADIVDSYNAHGIDEAHVNLDHIPADRFEFGVQQEIKTAFHTLLRVTLAADEEEFAEYFARLNDDDFIQVYFISKGDEEEQTTTNSPIATPVLRDRMCADPAFPNNGDEAFLLPKYEELREKLVKTMKKKFEYKATLIREIVGAEYVGAELLENNLLGGGNSPDCLYYEDYNNQSFLIKAPDGKQNILNMQIDGYRLREDNMFVIMGVNHFHLGLTAFNQETIYTEKYVEIKADGTTMNNFEYDGSAKYFDADEFYIIQYARPGRCVQEMANEGGAKCVEIGYEELPEDVGFIVFSRAYLNPCTDTGPSKQQFLPEYLLEFESASKGDKDGHGEEGMTAAMAGKVGREQYVADDGETDVWSFRFTSTVIQVLIVCTAIANLALCVSYRTVSCGVAVKQQAPERVPV